MYAKARQVAQRVRFAVLIELVSRSHPDGESNWPAICIACLALGVGASGSKWVTVTGPEALQRKPACIRTATPVPTLRNARVVVDTSPVNDFLLRFAVSGIGSPGCTTVTKATLRLTVGTNTDDGSPKGGVFFLAASSTWSESNVTWNTAPATVGQALASITTTVSLGGTYTVDITPAGSATLA